MNTKFLFVAGMMVLLAACAPYQQSSYPAPQSPPSSYPPQTGGSTQEPQPTRPTPSEVKPVESVSASSDLAIQQLIDQAWQLHHNRNFDRSNAVAERAMRLNASVAEIYLIMASNYFAMAELEMADNFARRGLSFSGNLWDIERRLKNILELVARSQ